MRAKPILTLQLLVDMGVMAMNGGGSTLPKAPELEYHH